MASHQHQQPLLPLCLTSSRDLLLYNRQLTRSCCVRRLLLARHLGTLHLKASAKKGVKFGHEQRSRTRASVSMIERSTQDVRNTRSIAQFLRPTLHTFLGMKAACSGIQVGMSQGKPAIDAAPSESRKHLQVGAEHYRRLWVVTDVAHRACVHNERPRL
eukprot:6175912-Pleurochrysis_carterae.AAC.2